MEAAWHRERRSLRREIAALKDRVQALDAAVAAQLEMTKRERRERLSAQIRELELEAGMHRMVIEAVHDEQSPLRIRAQERMNELLPRMEVLDVERASLGSVDEE